MIAPPSGPFPPGPAWPRAGGSGAGGPGAGAADITALAVKAANARQGVAAAGSAAAPPGAAPAREEAARIDPRTRELAEAAAAAATGGPEGAPSPAEARSGGSLAAAFGPHLDALRNGWLDAQATVEHETEKNQMLREKIRVFEETGEVWQPDATGRLARTNLNPDTAYRFNGGPAGYIEVVRRGVAVSETLHERRLANVEEARRAYESLRRDVLGR